MAFKFRERAGFHNSNFIADMSLIGFVMDKEFFGTFDGFFIKFMLNELFDGDDNSFLHFSGDDFADASFTFVTRHGDSPFYCLMPSSCSRRMVLI